MRHVLALSGGKASAAPALVMRREYRDLPVEYCFADTGRELPDRYPPVALRRGRRPLRRCRRETMKGRDAWITSRNKIGPVPTSGAG